MRKRYIFLLAAVVAVFTSLLVCNNKKSSEDGEGLPDYISYDKLPEDYSKEMAQEDGCIIIESGNFLQFEFEKQFSECSRLVSGKDLWEKFLTLKDQGEDARIRIYYYVSNADEEQGFPDHQILDLSCGNGKYMLSFEKNGEILTEGYDVLKCFEGDYHRQEWFLLGEKFENKDYSLLLRDLFSSKAIILGDYIPGKPTWKLIYISDEEG